MTSLAVQPMPPAALRKAFAAEARRLLPRLLECAHSRCPQPFPSAADDATRLAEGCRQLGDAAGAAALEELAHMFTTVVTPRQRATAGTQAALLLGRWLLP